MKRPRRPIKLTDAEYRMMAIAIRRMMTDDTITRRLKPEDYNAGIAMVTHVNAKLPLYKLGHSPIPPATDPNS